MQPRSAKDVCPAHLLSRRVLVVLVPRRVTYRLYLRPRFLSFRKRRTPASFGRTARPNFFPPKTTTTTSLHDPPRVFTGQPSTVFLFSFLSFTGPRVPASTRNSEIRSKSSVQTLSCVAMRLELLHTNVCLRIGVFFFFPSE